MAAATSGVSSKWQGTSAMLFIPTFPSHLFGLLDGCLSSLLCNAECVGFLTNQTPSGYVSKGTNLLANKPPSLNEFLFKTV